MSNIVSLKIQIEGSETIKTVSFSADELASALNKVRDSSNMLNGSIVNWSQAGAGDAQHYERDKRGC